MVTPHLLEVAREQAKKQSAQTGITIGERQHGSPGLLPDEQEGNTRGSGMGASQGNRRRSADGSDPDGTLAAETDA